MLVSWVRTFADGVAVSSVGKRSVPDIFVRIEVGARETRAHGLLGFVAGSCRHIEVWECPGSRL